ncbi:serine/arginine repetitive matrix protein 1 isoform X2 [Rhagoletis pomonella]|uniref:serine/arginine repetitive matrix protein 1 isoform X2 n=1 Tax=Rhagoletis pomonella TaxID=28610 RepID=UPI00177CCF12|nr:serine/arginine repetitive matrix protein 1 isoform X2 [Rhagoletis pomonella]
MSTSRRRGEINPKLHMDRQPTVARITDPSLPAGKRREIDNVMKKARANTNDYWDKKLIEVEEKDPNRWRHTGYKKMYIQGESSSGESDREGGFRYNSSTGGPVGGPVGGPPPTSGRYGRSRSPRSRSRSRLRKSPPMSPPMRRRSPPIEMGGRRMSPPSMDSMRGRPRSPPPRGGIPPRSPSDLGRGRMPLGGGSSSGNNRPRSPPEPPMRRKPSRSPLGRRRSPPNISRRRSPPPVGPNKRGQILPRSKRPPSPPPRSSCRSRSNSSVSSCSDDSCSVCSPKHHHRSRSHSLPRSRIPGGPRSPPPKSSSRSLQYRGGQPPPSGHTSSRMHARPTTPPPPNVRSVDKYRGEKVRRYSHDRSIDRVPSDGRLKLVRSGRHSPTEDPRVKNRPPEPPEPASSSSTTSAVAKKKKKDRELRTRIKIEGEKRKKHSSSESDDSGGSDSDSSLPTFIAATGLTLSERFGKMAQWSIDRSNMENMRITKDSTGGALKVMIEEGLGSPPRRYSYSPAPAGHFPEELATTAPSGMLSWDDVRVRYEYYKSRGYLRDLDLKDYIKWEEWWYKYQEWLKQERYYEYWERQQLARRRH